MNEAAGALGPLRGAAGWDSQKCFFQRAKA